MACKVKGNPIKTLLLSAAIMATIVACHEVNHHKAHNIPWGHGANRVIHFEEQNQAISSFESTEPQRQFEMLMRHKDELPAFQRKNRGKN